ncbi:MAG: DMT family transporter [Ectothiorhodospiraceae bacterium]
MLDRAGFSGIAAGLFTIGLWGSLPILRGLAALPPLLVTAVAMAAAAAVASGIALFQAPPAPDNTGVGWHHWIGGVGGLVGALFFYFLALENGDPAKVTLITYTWPLGLVLVGDQLAGRRLRLQPMVASGVAFTGLAPLLLSDAQGIATPAGAYAAGLASGGSWIVFSLFLRQAGALPARLYQWLFVRAGLVALGLHFGFESLPAEAASRDWLSAALIGIGPYGLAFIAWGFALRHGPTSLLGVLTYLVPVVAASLLILLGWTRPTPELLLAAAAVVTGAGISRLPPR